jgi:amidase
VQLTAGLPSGITFGATHDLYSFLQGAVLSGNLTPEVRATVEQAVRAGDPDPTNRGLVASHLDFLIRNEERLRNLAAWQRYFGEYDAFLLPVTFTAAFAHDHSPVLRQRVLQTSGGPRPYMDLSKWISFATLAGLPATTAPIGRTSAGLPVGLQIVGPYFEDATPIDIAGKLADVVGGFVPPPALA